MILAAALALLGGLSWQGTRERVSERPPPPAAALARSAPPSLPSAARASISRALGADSGAYWARPSGEGFRAQSGLERIEARFGRAGVRLRSGRVELRLRPAAAGYGAQLRPLGAAAPSALANRVEYVRPGLREWYVNGPAGVEQGFTAARTSAAHGAGPLTLALGLSGNARFTASADRRSITASYRGAALRYAGLSASDSSGRTLRSWLELRGRTLLLRVDTAGARFPVTVDPLVEHEELLNPTGVAGAARFGVSVALSADGRTALVGAPGDQSLLGAAWVFTQTGGVWAQQAKLMVNESGGEPEEAACLKEESECRFGSSVALAADGNTALIGAPREAGGAGAAWVFTRSGATWSRLEALTGGPEEKGDGRFGRSVALSGDGATALVGAPRDRDARGAAWVFARAGSAFVHQGPKLTGAEEAPESFFGRSVALSADGNSALAGSPGDSGYIGAAWAFTRSGGAWAQQGAKLTGAGEAGPGRFGFSVALSADAGTAMIGGRSDEGGAGAAWPFINIGSSWAPQGAKLTGGEASGPTEFGYSIALSGDGASAVIGGPRDGKDVGAVWRFAHTGMTWAQAGEKFAPSATGAKGRFGTSVALASTSGVTLVGAPLNNVSLGTASSFGGNPPPPSVTSVNPTSGPAAGGTSVTITGSGFLAGASVTIGNAATSVKVISETELTAVTAATAPGGDEVVVTGPNGTSTGGPTYTYVAPPPGPVARTAPVATAATGVLAGKTLALAPPTLGVTGNLTPLSGVVRVKLPGSKHFVLLSAAAQVPLGTIVDATAGKVSVTTASVHGGTQIAVFYLGEFKLTQARSGLALATLLGGRYAVCPTSKERLHLARANAARASRKHTVRKLWAESHGSYSTKGNYATGAAQGTRWLTQDLCEGTLITVISDRVTVTNLITHRRATVAAGKKYLARVG